MWLIIINSNNYYFNVYLKIDYFNKKISYIIIKYTLTLKKMLDNIEIKYMIEDMNKVDIFINKQKQNMLHLKKVIDYFFSRQFK